MNPPLLDTFTGRVRLEGTLSTHTGLHIGAGGSGDPLATDAPVVRDAAGRPFIPGSSLKGVLRSAAEALLRQAPGKLCSCNPVGQKPCVDHDRLRAIREEVLETARAEERERHRRLPEEERSRTEPREPEEPDPREVARRIWEESCTVCRLFGSLAMASRVRFPDLPLEGSLPLLELRNGVGIDRDRELAAPGVLYDFEAIPPGTAFRLTVIVDNPLDADMGLLLYLFEELSDGNLSLGGKTSRGLGQVRVEWRRVEETRLEKDNPFTELLARRDLLAGDESEEEAASGGGAPEPAPALPTSGDPTTWERLARLLEELPEVDKGRLGHLAKERYDLTKGNLNEKLALGLDKKAIRQAWDVALGRLAECGFLIAKGGGYVLASRAAEEQAAEEAVEEKTTHPAWDRLLKRYLGAMARCWERQGEEC